MRTTIKRKAARDVVEGDVVKINGRYRTVTYAGEAIYPAKRIVITATVGATSGTWVLDPGAVVPTRV